jgi:hypothetical protein
MSKSKKLINDGYLVINPKWMTDELRKELRVEFLQTCRTFPEFRSPKDDVYVLGGFSALGNPGSFHNPFVRKLRQWVMWSVVPVLKRLANGRKIEQVMDRMMFRTEGKVVASETWHRDEAPKAVATDDVFGGWINLDPNSNFFSCIPGSHKGVSKHSGFGKEKPGDVDSKNKMLVEVPPGHIIVFFERILHEVNKKKAPKEGIMRLFLGWRLTHGHESILDNLVDMCKSQGVPNLKSDQVPAMYSVYHKNVWIDMLVDFSNSFNKECLVRQKVKGRELDIVPIHMPSLKSMGLPMYPRYKSGEISIYTPNTKWKLVYPGSEKRYVLEM